MKLRIVLSMQMDTQINFRLSSLDKTQIEANAKKAGKKVGPFLRDLGLDFGTHLQIGVPSEPRNQGSGPQLPDGGVYPPVAESSDVPVEGAVGAVLTAEGAIRKATEDDIAQLVTQLKGQGMTTRVATQEAKKRLGL